MRDGWAYPAVRPTLRRGVHRTDETTISTDTGQEAEEHEYTEGEEGDSRTIRNASVVKVTDS